VLPLLPSAVLLLPPLPLRLSRLSLPRLLCSLRYLNHCCTDSTARQTAPRLAPTTASRPEEERLCQRLLQLTPADIEHRRRNQREGRSWRLERERSTFDMECAGDAMVPMAVSC
jgi:hypothetical protein